MDYNSFTFISAQSFRSAMFIPQQNTRAALTAVRENAGKLYTENSQNNYERLYLQIILNQFYCKYYTCFTTQRLINEFHTAQAI